MPIKLHRCRVMISKWGGHLREDPKDLIERIRSGGDQRLRPTAK
jgi:hypothetical protein